MGKFLVRAAATVALNVFAPLAHAQDYVVNGHAASKAEAVLLTSYSICAASDAADRSLAPSNITGPAVAIVRTTDRRVVFMLDLHQMGRFAATAANIASMGGTPSSTLKRRGHNLFEFVPCLLR